MAFVSLEDLTPVIFSSYENQEDIVQKKYKELQKQRIQLGGFQKKQTYRLTQKKILFNPLSSLSVIKADKYLRRASVISRLKTTKSKDSQSESQSKNHVHIQD